MVRGQSTIAGVPGCAQLLAERRHGRLIGIAVKQAVRRLALDARRLRQACRVLQASGLSSTPALPETSSGAAASPSALRASVVVHGTCGGLCTDNSAEQASICSRILVLALPEITTGGASPHCSFRCRGRPPRSRHWRRLWARRMRAGRQRGSPPWSPAAARSTNASGGASGGLQQATWQGWVLYACKDSSVGYRRGEDRLTFIPDDRTLIMAPTLTGCGCMLRCHGNLPIHKHIHDAYGVGGREGRLRLTSAGLGDSCWTRRLAGGRSSGISGQPP